ncbi:MAG TPA: MFS transporter [Thermoanaerobaculia bacterium]|nr:MFS transporter [Thermoanaerobaculia bacterium]
MMEAGGVADEANVPLRLMNRNFLLLWQGQGVSQLGNQAFAVAMAFWVVDKTGSASLMGLLLAMRSLPMVLLAPVGGAVADRFSRLRVLILCDVIAGGAMVGLSIAMFSGRFSVPILVAMLFAVGLLSGVISAFFQPALGSSIPDLVPAERLSAANSLNQFSVQGAALVGQGVGGVLYRLLGGPQLFLFNGLSFFFSAVCSAFIRMPPMPQTSRRERLGLAASVRQFARTIREGFTYVLQTPGLLGYIAAPASYNFFSFAVFVLLPFFVRINLNAGAEWYGFLLAAMSAGAVGGFIIAGLVRFTGAARARFVTALIVVAPVPMLTVGFVHRPAIALVMSFGLGALIGMINVNLMTLLQANTPAELRGRVIGLWTALVSALTPLGMALGGFAGDLTGKNIPLVYTTCGAINLLITALTVSRSSTQRYLSRA